jgi:hypothetical protein
MRWYTVNLQGIDETEDGTGIDPTKLADFLQGPAKKWGRTLMVGVCVYKDIDPLVYRPIYQQIRFYGHRTFARICDSATMKEYSVREYERLYQKHLEVNGRDIDVVECANEVSGSRPETRKDKHGKVVEIPNQWPGPDAAEKMNRALKVCLNANKPRVVTLFWNNDDPGYVWEWCKAHPFSAEVVLMSDYRLQAPAPWSGLTGIKQQMRARFPKALIGFGEYGCEGGDGVDRATADTRLSMLHEFETCAPIDANDIQGGFFWDGYKWLVSTPNPDIIATYAGAFK